MPVPFAHMKYVYVPPTYTRKVINMYSGGWIQWTTYFPGNTLRLTFRVDFSFMSTQNTSTVMNIFSSYGTSHECSIRYVSGKIQVYTRYTSTYTSQHTANICDGNPHNITIIRSSSNIAITIDGVTQNFSQGTLSLSTSDFRSNYSISGAGAAEFKMWDIHISGYNTTTKGTLIPCTEGSGSNIYFTGSSTVAGTNYAGWTTVTLPT